MAKAKTTYATVLSTKETPQNQPIPGREKEQVLNNAGGYVFQTSAFKALERFLILGSDKSTYYVSAQKLTKDNAANIRKCLKEDGKATVDMIVTISEAGRAPKNDPAIFALAVASVPAFGSAETAAYALSKLSKVCRIGTHMFHFTEYLKSMRGFGRQVKTAIANWYREQPVDKLAYQLTKYQQRDSWSTKSVVSLAHVKTLDARQSAVLAWGVSGGLDALKDNAENWTRPSKKYNLTETEVTKRRTRFQSAYDILTSENAPKVIVGYEAAKKATTAKDLAKIIREYGLTHEMIPTQFKKDAEVWEALLEKMPMTAMVRNLGNMASCSLLTPLSNASQTIISRLADEALIKKSRIHPMQLLLANGVFSQGHGNKGSNTWTVVQPVVDALEAAFYLAFVNVVPTGKKLYIGLDISGSMRSDFTPGSGISSAKAGAAMCLVAARTEQNYAIFGFSCGSSGSWTGGTHMIDLGFTAKDTLTSALDKTSRHNFGATDCSMPFQHAEKTNLDVDAFLTITDNETWNGSVQPVQALAKYRAIRNKLDVRSIVMAMTATEFTIADPNDPYSLDIVGFDTNVPALITDFIRGESAGNAVSADDL